ncbi:MAG: hypothetical protein LQ348_000833 [Seirophora lacunosa]|nr:MAG: hypothetical protein LQ344_003922 [Seirophora lacunosa]KAI4206765.1 MAG: hypothetical protein LQ348_000833 [Seirophora lacunosa]
MLFRLPSATLPHAGSPVARFQSSLVPRITPSTGKEWHVCVPGLILAAINAKNLWDEHWEHWEHLPPLEDRIEYPYMNIRTKKYFWGDGDKTLFWNDKVNYHHKDE